MIQHVIARYGEISLKGKNRHNFEQILVRNMQHALRGFEGPRVSRIGGRVLVTLNGAPEDEVIQALSRVFGIISLSAVEVCDLDVDKIYATAISVLQRELASMTKHTFKVEVKRSNKRFPIPSPQFAGDVGYEILQAIEGIRVDVNDPERTVYVEIRDDEVFVYCHKVEAVGGMPVGSSGKVGLLLSGGIDSPVAGWLGMKRGVELEGIHFHSFPFTSERALEKVETLAKILANWGGRVRLHTVPFTRVQTEIRKHCPEELSITIMRRMMLRISAEIAKERKLLAIMTGESLGQVASQTLESMHVINEVTTLPVLRPLISEDKVDIIRRSRMIGTYETSILPFEDCCTIFLPKSPRTRPKLSEAVRAEAKLDVEALVRDAVENTTMKTFLAADEG